MNCCDDYGKCTSGKDCAVRSSKELPVQYWDDEDEHPYLDQSPSVLEVVVAITALLALFVILALAIGGML